MAQKLLQTGPKGLKSERRWPWAKRGLTPLPKPGGKASGLDVDAAPLPDLEDARTAFAVQEQALLRAAQAVPRREGARAEGPPVLDARPERAELHATERQIVASFTESVNRVRETVHARVSDATTKILKLAAKMDAARGEEAGARARLEIANARAEHRDDLIAAEREVMAAERDVRVFRLRNGITREPALPRDQIISGAWLAVILVLEAVFNTPFFLMEGQSLVGASFEGLLVSGANIGLGLTAGIVGLRLAGHRYLFPWKIAGVATLVAAVAGAVSLNGLMAVRRITGAEGEHATALMGALSPVVLTVAFTAFASMGFLFAAYKGWQGFFEPYPGYGQAAKRLAKARRRVEDLRHDFHHAAREAIEKIQEDLEEEIDTDRDAVAAARMIATDAEEAEIKARDSVNELRARAQWLIRLYHETAADADGGDRAPPPPADLETMLAGEAPSAGRALDAVDKVERRLEQNERAYAEGLRDLRDALTNLENDLARSHMEAEAAARAQRAKEIEAEEARAQRAAGGGGAGQSSA